MAKEDLVKHVATQAVKEIVDESLRNQAESLREVSRGDLNDAKHHADIAQSHIDAAERIADSHLKDKP